MLFQISTSFSSEQTAFAGLVDGSFIASIQMCIRDSDIPYWKKYTLSIEEAASYFRIGEGKLRKLVSDLSLIHIQMCIRDRYRDSNIPKNRIVTIAVQIKTLAAMCLDEPSGVSGQYGTVAKLSLIHIQMCIRDRYRGCVEKGTMAQGISLSKKLQGIAGKAGYCSN